MILENDHTSYFWHLSGGTGNGTQAFNLNVECVTHQCSPLTTNTLLPLSYKLKKKKKKKKILLLQLHLDTKDTSLVPNQSSIYALSIDTDGSHSSTFRGKNAQNEIVETEFQAIIILAELRDNKQNEISITDFCMSSDHIYS